MNGGLCSARWFDTQNSAGPHPAVRAAGHALRNTAATNAILAGVYLAIVSPSDEARVATSTTAWSEGHC